MSSSRVLAYHEVSKHSPESVRRSSRGLDWPNKPFPYKDYAPGLRSISLSMPDAPLPVSALDAVAGLGLATVRDLDAGEVGRILNYGAGVMRKRPISRTQAMYFRTYASAGGLYPVEVYAVAGDLPTRRLEGRLGPTRRLEGRLGPTRRLEGRLGRGLAAGLYHYHPRRRALVALREGDYRGSLVDATASEPTVAEAPLTLVLTGIPWRTAWKYGPRGFRHLYWDAGMIVANILALATAAGLPARVVLGFDDAALQRLLGIDGRHEFPLCLLSIGSGSPVPPAAPAPDLALGTRPLSAEEIEYPQIVAAQDAGRLHAGDVAAWRGSSGRTGPPLEATLGPGDLLEDVIRRRGSARSFDARPMPAGALGTILDRSTRGVPTDVAPAGSALAQPYLIANRVEGLKAGVYRYDEAFHLLAAGDFAEQAAYLCLEQRLGHDAAAAHFLMVDLGDVLDRFGDRGYRVAQLEAGVLAGRMYLAAEAHRVGATGLTFYDDDVARFFSGAAEGDPRAPKSCMLVLAVGPATRRLLPLA